MIINDDMIHDCLLNNLISAMKSGIPLKAEGTLRKGAADYGISSKVVIIIHSTRKNLFSC